MHKMLPELMMRIWDGDPDERFRAVDMNRLAYNTNILAREAGVEQESFMEVTRTDQFYYSEATKLEGLQKAIGDAMGVPLTIETYWHAGRPLSYSDFERWESNNWALYKAMGGVGERIPSDKFLHTVNATLFAGAWRGDGPYYMDLDVPMVYADRDVIAYVPHTATLEERMAERHALLRAVTTGDRKVRVWALSKRPRINIPMRMTLGVFRMIETKTLTASGWAGSGPWTQTITLSNAVSDAVIGAVETMTDAQVRAFTSAGISASAVNGTSLTIRAILEKPSMDLPIGVMYNSSSVI